jgi:hypothetical protein
MIISLKDGEHVRICRVYIRLYSDFYNLACPVERGRFRGRRALDLRYLNQTEDEDMIGRLVDETNWY